MLDAFIIDKIRRERAPERRERLPLQPEQPPPYPAERDPRAPERRDEPERGVAIIDFTI